MPVTLENSFYRVAIAPEQGAGIVSCHVRGAGGWWPLMPDARAPGSDLAAACFIMAPYSNRIAAGRFVFGGRQHQLDRGEVHAIHGDVRTRAWATVERTSTAVVCRLDTRAQERLNWPWPFLLQASYQLQGPHLCCKLELTNVAAEPAPAGFGWHPYFSRTLRQVDEPVWLQFRASGAYPDAHGTRLPSGPARRLRAAEDFASGRRLRPDHFLDTCYSGYDGAGRICWPASGLEAHLECSPSCSHLVVYNPAGKAYFAVEPVTNANNGINLLADGDPTGGIQVLEPGQVLAATFRLRARLTASPALPVDGDAGRPLAAP